MLARTHLVRIFFSLSIVGLCLPSASSAQTFSLDRQREQHEFGLRLDFGFIKDDGTITADKSVMRTEVYGQFISGAFGGYMSLPLARSLSFGPDNERTAIGNMELGGYWMTVAGPVDFILRFGMSLPTADASLEGFSTNANASLARLTDQLNVEPGILGTRISISPVINADILFFRIDFGFDFIFRTRELYRDTSAYSLRAQSAANDDFRLYLRANVGIGADFDLATVAIEFVNVISLADELMPYGVIAVERSMHAITFGTWFNLDIVHPYVAFTIPVDGGTTRTQGFALTTGVEVRL